MLSLALFGADFNRGYASDEFRFESFLEKHPQTNGPYS